MVLRNGLLIVATVALLAEVGCSGASGTTASQTATQQPIATTLGFISEIRNIVAGSPVDGAFSSSALQASSKEVLAAVLTSLRGIPDLKQDEVRTLETVNSALASAGIDPKTDFGLAKVRTARDAEARTQLASQIRAAIAGTAVERSFYVGSGWDYFDAAVLQRMLSTLRSTPNLNQDPAVTLAAVVASAQTAGLDLSKAGDLFGLQGAKETAAREAAREKEIAARPRLEVMNVQIGSNSLGLLQFTVTMRNNSAVQIDGTEYDVYAYNRFGEALGRECGRFPTSYSSSRVETATSGATFVRTVSPLCLNTATKVDVRITRAHFTDGTTWRP